MNEMCYCGGGKEGLMTLAHQLAADAAGVRGNRSAEYAAEQEAVKNRRAAAVASVRERLERDWLPKIKENAAEGRTMTSLRWGGDTDHLDDYQAIANAGEVLLIEQGFKVERPQKPCAQILHGSGEFADERVPEREFVVYVPKQ